LPRPMTHNSNWLSFFIKLPLFWMGNLYIKLTQ